MNRFVFLLGLVFALFLLSGETVAPQRAEAASDSDYVFADGFHWHNGQAYNRTTTWYKTNWRQVTYYDYGYCSYKYYWTYDWAKSYSYDAVKLNYESEDLETQLIGLAKARDKAVLQIAAKNQKHIAVMELADKLGLAGNFQIPGYGQGIFPVANSSGYQVTAVGIQGSTVFGYGPSYRQTVDAYGTLDLNAGLQASARLTETAMGLADGSNKGFQGLVARTLEVFRPTEPQGHVRTTTTITGSVGVPGATVITPGPTANRVDQVAFLALSGPAKCVKCHTGNDVKGGFDISKYHPLTADAVTRNRVVRYLISDDPDKRCPPKSDPLDGVELSHFTTGR